MSSSHNGASSAVSSASKLQRRLSYRRPGVYPRAHLNAIQPSRRSSALHQVQQSDEAVKEPLRSSPTVTSPDSTLQHKRGRTVFASFGAVGVALRTRLPMPVSVRRTMILCCRVFPISGAEHKRCWVHFLRDLKDLREAHADVTEAVTWGTAAALWRGLWGRSEPGLARGRIRGDVELSDSRPQYLLKAVYHAAARSPLSSREAGSRERGRG